MKKLTAGIFATILGLTAVDAFAATGKTTVASTNYVDGALESLTVEKVGTSEATSYIKNVSETNGKISAESGTLAKVATTGAYSDLTGIPTDIVTEGDIGDMATKTWVEGKGYLTEHQSLAEYAKTAEVESTYATKTALEGVKTTAEAAAPQATTYTKTEVDDKIGGVTTSLNGYVTTTTYDAGMALKADASTVSDLAKDVDTNTKAIADVVTVNEQQSGLIETNATHIKDLQDAKDNYVTWADVDDKYGD